MKTLLIPVALPLFIFILAGCGPGRSPGGDAAGTGEGISVEGAWARPGTEGRMSAGYFLITNFEDEPDTLKSISTAAAGLAEIHESYEEENGMAGMREVRELVIPAETTVQFRPGGFHVMLIRLTRELSEGDEFELHLRFSTGGEITVTVPVRS